MYDLVSKSTRQWLLDLESEPDGHVGRQQHIMIVLSGRRSSDLPNNPQPMQIVSLDLRLLEIEDH